MSDSDPTPDPLAGDVDVDAVAAATVACPSVTHLVGGAVGEQVATYLPGRRVAGVRVRSDEVEVHVAVRWGVTAAEVAAEVRAAVAPLVGRRAVAVAVDDIGDPQGELPAGGGAGGEPSTGDRPIAVPAPS